MAVTDTNPYMETEVVNGEQIGLLAIAWEIRRWRLHQLDLEEEDD